MDYLKKLSPPFTSKENETYITELKNKFEFFNKYLIESDFNRILSSEDYSSISTISKSILDAIEEYLQGNSGNAYKKIENLLTTEYKHLENITYNLSNKNQLIRIRKSITNLNKRKDLFHIPFNLRQKVAKQRYSIEGLPCLYLAASSYVTWLELNKPSFNEMWVSAFRPTKQIPILDLSYTLGKLENDYKKSIQKEYTIDKLKFFPFVLATSFRVKHLNDFFHEEYIISGKLLQWVTNNTTFKGIRYLSTKLESYENLEFLWCASNFVIPPVKPKKEEVYNEILKKSFKTTEPQNCSVLIAYGNAGEVAAYHANGDEFEEFTNENLKADNSLSKNIDELIFKNYLISDFYNIDGYLRDKFTLDYI
ncbi:hypothetical protein BY457_112126 [Marinilabilia salmonicolor]|jgi:hypothetical protein|uniref:hypothetical protein n=1 Tax=Marinilabilia salmonicolor TaxID=989 RepID=UPI000D0814F0|nr:hypothetical protein [Marinilabilia salmonicolor]PRY97442.1 hypothetical protein BY457_112126 [Marinilabilia salmonicolor]